MIKPAQALLLSVALSAAAAAVQAQSPQENVIRLLLDQGFEITSQRRTLLGRFKIVATDGTYIREIVILPTTGDVLRDQLTYATGENRGRNAWGAFRTGQDRAPEHSSAGGTTTQERGTSARPSDPGRSSAAGSARGSGASENNNGSNRSENGSARGNSQGKSNADR